MTWLSVADEKVFMVKRTQFKQSDSSCTTSKTSDILKNINICYNKGDDLESKEVKRIYRGRFHAYKRKGLPHMQRDLQRHPYHCTLVHMASSVDGIINRKNSPGRWCTS